ncbi:CoA-disulfide reductase [Neisseriaceae bacterium PsAf]|nr:CoA-disulfide reductase [Neisseriaceae bacterium PsAf]
MAHKVVIVGGVAGGASCAARLRRLSEEVEILLLEKGPYISFANCGLPYHIGGIIPNRDSLLLQTPESFKKRFNIEVRVKNQVLSIDRENKTLEIKDLNSNDIYQESYDQLLLSPGGKPVDPFGMEENHLEHVHCLRNISDMDAIIQDLDSSQPKHATVVGGGFIGLEMVEALRQRGLQVSLLELSNQVMPSVDLEMANFLHQELVKQSVDLKLEIGLQEIKESSSAESQLTLKLTDESILQTDLVILAIGVKPDIGLAEEADIVIGEKKGIRVNKIMQTNDVDIFAVGDAVETFHFVTQEPTLVPLAGPENRQGRIAADNMMSRKTKYDRSQGTSICKLFDYAIASTGMSEKKLQEEKKPYIKINVHAKNHAGYYPNAQMISLKLLFHPETGAILGAQVFGQEGVDKRIDVLAVAQRADMTVRDLVNLELCYAPPFGSARDIVNLAGMVASNVLDGDVQLTYSESLEECQKKGAILLDVRGPEEIEKIGAFPEAINIPLPELRERVGELDKDKYIITACQIGIRGYFAYRFLTLNGFKVSNLDGGYRTYQMFKKDFK